MLLTQRELAWLDSKVNSYNRKARRLGQSPMEIVIGELHDPNSPFPEGFVCSRKHLDLWEITIEGKLPQVIGYELLGKIEPATEGLNMVCEVPGKTIPVEYRTADMSCDHCGHNRRRNSTLILRELATDKVIQVGRNCLQDFLPKASVDHLLLIASWAEFSSPQEADDEVFGHYRSKSNPFVAELIALATRVIAERGFVSRATAQANESAWSTSQCVMATYCDPKEESPTAAEYAEAQLVIDYFQAIPKEEADKNAFLWNLWLIAKSATTPLKNIGFVCYMPEYIRREKEKRINRELAAAKDALIERKHIGTVGDKVNLELILTGITYIEGTFGCTSLYKFQDSTGNYINWFSSRVIGDLEHNEGKSFKVKGTIKAHQEYMNKPQTVLTRCKVERILENASV